MKCMILLQNGFDSRDGLNYAVIPHGMLSTDTNADIIGRWVFPTLLHPGTTFVLNSRPIAYRSKVIFQIQVFSSEGTKCEKNLRVI